MRGQHWVQDDDVICSSGYLDEKTADMTAVTRQGNSGDGV
jgi:hypothetical protein